MVKDPAPDNFWRSAKWVIRRNKEVLYDHSAAGRARHKKYSVSEKRRAKRRRYQTSVKGRAAQRRYNTSEKGRAAYQRYAGTEKSRACHQRDEGKQQFQKDPLRFIKRQMNAPKIRILGAINGGI